TDVDGQHPVRGRAQHPGHPRRRLQLDVVPLPVAKAERVADLSLGPAHRQGGRRVEAAREQHDGSRHEGPNIPYSAASDVARSNDDEIAGAREHFEDVALYDFEYR